MKTIRLVKKLVKIQNLTPSQERSTGAAFNNSKSIVGCLTDYLSSEIPRIDKKLNNPEVLYKSAGAERYVAALLGERSTLNNLLELLTQEVTVLDDDPSGEYNV